MGFLKTPYGTKDFLPKEAADKRAIEYRLTRLFARYGYEEVVTPTMEFLETLTMSGGTSEKNLFKIIDQKNQTLALHHEMTTPIARLAVSRLQESTLPLKLSYNTSVFRFRQNQPQRQCEFYQAGVELLGVSNAVADAEIIALAAQSLQYCGLSEFKICLGQVEFANGLMEQFNLPLDNRNKIKSAIERHDMVELEKIVEGIEGAKVLSEIPKLHGGIEILNRAGNLVDNKKSYMALQNLAEIYDLTKIYGVDDKIIFDLGIIRDFEYYTGMVFEVYAPNVGYSLAGGGRYDDMLKDFGLACPATGFALGIERILQARELQGVDENFSAKDVYIGYHESQVGTAIKRALELREVGKVVELALTPQTFEEATKISLEKNFSEMIYFGN